MLVNKTLVDWLINHISKVDKKIGRVHKKPNVVEPVNAGRFFVTDYMIK
ncbi:hypothetical protein [Thermoanaerobacter wiegelii]|nr:hypothetical protein [Thermoanaerobacter wiegelii]